jgi:hypothetical protein
VESVCMDSVGLDNGKPIHNRGGTAWACRDV